MRWPLRNQILTRMLLLLLLTVVAITFASIRSGVTANRERQSQRVAEIADVLTRTRFPLTASVLENMKALSGAEFVLVDESDQRSASTSGAPAELARHDVTPEDSATLGNPIVSNGQPYYHAVVRTYQQRDRNVPAGYLHVFLPRQSDASIWWQSSRTPLLIAGLILPVALLFGLALASQVTRPLAELRSQAQRIAEGDPSEISIRSRDDEIRDLHEAMNDMARRIRDHDLQLRKNERLQMMIQFGNGIAHHLRNSATGCKMAIELLASENPDVSGLENYQVALRQLDLMDNYIKKFVLLSKSTDPRDVAAVDAVELGDTLARVIYLLRPSAEHLGVDLLVAGSGKGIIQSIAPEDAEQLMINLINNAIAAASQLRARVGDHPAVVEIDLTRQRDGMAVMTVSDNGPGPAPEIADRIFQPFVTGSAEGTGLGLSLVREIAERIPGTVSWTRSDGWTRFRFEFGLTRNQHEGA